MSFISQNLSTFGVIIVAGYLVYKEYRSGTDKLDEKIKSNYETLIAQQEKEIKESKEKELKYQRDQGEMRKEIANMKEAFAKTTGDLQGQINAKDKQIKELTDTILNRNPDLENLILDTNKTMKDVRILMSSMFEQNKHQTRILEQAKARNDKIDEATEREKGHVLRKD